MTDTRLEGRPVIVTTEYRGVFFGYAKDTTGDTIELARCRNCLYWPASQGGFMGLASEGPQHDARIGARVPLFQARKVTSIIEMTETAVAAWEGASVYRG